MSCSLRYAPRSSSVILFSIAAICCALESGGFRLSTLSGSLLAWVTSVLQAAALGCRVVLPCVSLVGQNFAICSCWRQRKHWPSAKSFLRSSSVSFFRGGAGVRDMDVASTSIGTMPSLRGVLRRALVLWYC